MTIDMPIEPDADDDTKAGIAMFVDGGWEMLRQRVVDEFAKSGVSESAIEFRHYVRMQYYGQLNDIEILSPHQQIEEASQVDDLIAAFEDAYGKLYARSARSPELGYLLTNVIVGVFPERCRDGRFSARVTGLRKPEPRLGSDFAFLVGVAEPNEILRDMRRRVTH